MNDLVGKVALVTGASRGIGKSIAKELASQGAAVIINCSKDVENAKKVLDEISEAGGFGKVIVKDISNYNNCKELINEIIDNFGKIDILVNNAGISKIGLFMDSDEEDIHNIINVNLLSVMYLSKLVLPQMISKGKGNIVNISSIWGECGASCEVLYSTTKGGINLFTKALAKEVAAMGVRVNGVAPGVINTEMNNFLSKEEKDSLIEEIPMGRLGEGYEVAKVVTFLCKEDSSYLTGQIIKVDGAII